MADYIELRHKSFISSTIFMTIGALALFWFPFLNGALAGAAGGWRAGRVARAFEAALAATVLSGGAFFIAYHVFQISPNYLYSGYSLLGWMLLTGVGLIFGALTAAYARSSVFLSQHFKKRSVVRGTIRRSHEGPPVTGAPTSRFDEPL